MDNPPANTRPSPLPRASDHVCSPSPTRGVGQSVAAPRTPQDILLGAHLDHLEEMSEKETWKREFEKTVFGIEVEAGTGILLASPVSKKSSKLPTKKVWDKRVDCCLRWGGRNMSEKALKDLRRENKAAYRWVDTFFVSTNDDNEHTLFWGKNHPGTPKIVLHQGQVFEVLYNLHVHVGGHKKAAWIANQAKETFYNIAEDVIKAFIKLCPTCCLDAPKKQKFKGAKKPIESHEFRDRDVVDLIDYRMNPCKLDPDDKSPHAPISSWLMTKKDHAARLVYLRPILGKSPMHVARELNHIYSFMGYPLIFHTDNGNEFKAQVVQCLKELNPFCCIVTGRARTPRDQGSIERANRDIKDIIAKCVYEKRKNFEDQEEAKKRITWTTECATAMRVINSHRSRGTGETTPYEAVFGMSYHSPLLGKMLTQEDPGNYDLDAMLRFLGDDFGKKMAVLGEVGTQPSPDVVMPADSVVPNFDAELLELKSLAASLPADDESHSRARVNLLPQLDEISAAGGRHPKEAPDGEDDRKQPVEDSPLSSKLTEKAKSGGEMSPVEKSDDIPSSLTTTGKGNDKKKSASGDMDLAREVVEPSETQGASLLSPPAASVNEPRSIGHTKEDCASPSRTKQPVSKLKLTKVPSTRKATTRAISTLPTRANLKPTPPAKGCNLKTPPPPGSNLKTPPPGQDAAVGGAQSNTVEAIVKEEPKESKNKPKSVREQFAEQKNKEFVMVTLACRLCVNAAGSTLTTLPFYGQHEAKTFSEPKKWFTSEFCLSYLKLAKHAGHRSDVELIANLYPHGVLNEEDLVVVSGEVATLVQLAHADNHYALLVYNLKDKRVIVHDGLRKDLDTWRVHVSHTLKKYSLVGFAAQDTKFLLSTSRRPGKNGTWRMENEPSIRQDDNYSCGPIACFIGQLYLKPEKKTRKGTRMPLQVYDEYDNAVSEMRKFVVADYHALCKQYEPSVRSFRRLDFIDLTASPGNVVDNVAETGSDTVSENSRDGSLMCHEVSAATVPEPETAWSCCICLETETVTGCRFDTPCNHQAHLTCLKQWRNMSRKCPYCRALIPWKVLKEAEEEWKRKEDARQQKAVAAQATAIEEMSARRRKGRLQTVGAIRARQDNQAEKMIKRARLNIVKIVPGDVVVVRVEKAQRSRATGLHVPAVVVDVTESTGSAKLVTEWGMLGEGGAIAWFPSDRWEKKPVNIVLSPALAAVRDSVRNGSTKYKVCDDKDFITVSAAHRRMIPDAAQGTNRCGCKKMCSSNTCKCRKHGTMCYSGCGCGGQCQHTLDMASAIRAERHGSAD